MIRGDLFGAPPPAADERKKRIAVAHKERRSRVQASLEEFASTGSMPPALSPSRVHPKIEAQGFEARARIMENIAADFESEIPAWIAEGNPEQAQDRRERADHLRALAQRMRTEKRPLA